MKIWFTILAAVTIGGVGDSDVILINHTGLRVARFEIDKRIFESEHNEKKLLVRVTPEKHNLKIVFAGGSDVSWPRLDFKGVHEIFFERIHNRIVAHLE